MTNPPKNANSEHGAEPSPSTPTTASVPSSTPSPAVPPRREELILAAALTEFADKGYAGASVQAIASRAGVAKGLVFHHFSTKKQLYLNVLNKAYRDLMTEVTPHLKQDSGFVEMIVSASNAKLRFLRRNPAVNQLLLSAFQGVDAEVAAEARHIYQKQYGTAQAIMATKLETLPLRAGVQPQEALALIMSAMEMVQQLVLSQRGRTASEVMEQIDSMVDTFLRYLDLAFYGILDKPVEIDRSAFTLGEDES